MSATCSDCGIAISGDGPLCVDCEARQADEQAFGQTVLRPRGTQAAPQIRLSDGRLVPLDKPVLLGRNPMQEAGATSISVADPEMSVSKTHVRVELRDGQLIVTDLHSTNGAYLRSEDGSESQLAPGEETPVPVGAAVLFGSQSLALEPTADSPEPAAARGVEVPAADIAEESPRKESAAGLISAVPLAEADVIGPDLSAAYGEVEPELQPTAWEPVGGEEPERLCPQCGSAVGPANKFCMVCGGAVPAAPQQPAPAGAGSAPSTPEQVPCPSCGEQNRPTSKFCKSCGSPIAAQQPAAMQPAAMPAQPASPTPALVAAAPAGAGQQGATAAMSIGDIQVVGQEIRTPQGNAPLAGSTWTSYENLTMEEYLETSTVVAAVILALFCLLGLLLLLKKSQRPVGVVTVTVTSGQFQHSTEVYVRGQQQLTAVRSTVEWLKSASQ